MWYVQKYITYRNGDIFKYNRLSHRNCVFFGDGAGAVVLGKSEKGWIFTEIKSDGSGTGFSGFNCGLDTKYKTNHEKLETDIVNKSSTKLN